MTVDRDAQRVVAEPGKEDVLLQAASAYEAASKRRIPPPAFPPLAVEQRAHSD